MSGNFRYQYDYLESLLTKHLKNIKDHNLPCHSNIRFYANMMRWNIYHSDKDVKDIFKSVERCLDKASTGLINYRCNCIRNEILYNDSEGRHNSWKESFERCQKSGVWKRPFISYSEGITSERENENND